MRLAVVSDTHLSRATPEALRNWDAIVDHLADDPPDLVVHAGDLTLDGANDGQDLDDARRLLDRLPAPWRAVPGNHDIGDNPRPEQAAGEAVDDERRDRWLATIGADWWSERVDGWTVVAVDAQLFGSGLAAEAEQRQWLEGALGGVPADGRLVFVTHKPVTGPADELASAPPYRFLPPPTRAWLGDLLAASGVPMIVSGHVHQYRVLELGGRCHAWAPTTWAVLPDDAQPTFGTKRGGILTLQLHDDGPGHPTLVEPPGFAQHVLIHDVPNPYQH